MGANSKIEWTTHTFNPWWGCAKVAAGCANCYAESQAKRYGHAVWGKGAPRRFMSDAHWRQPLKWAREAQRVNVEVAASDALDTYGTWRPRVFCGSMCDVFEDRPELVKPRLRLFDLIDETPELDWLLLTKRPENAEPMMRYWDAGSRNAWLGTSVACQEDADRNVPLLLNVPAAVRFLSIEPLVGPVDLGDDFWESGSRVDWIIVGGESGPHARPCDVAWIRSLVEQARTALVPVFVKQVGAASLIGYEPSEPDEVRGEPVFLNTRDPKGSDPAEWPEDLRVREFPEVRA